MSDLLKALPNLKKTNGTSNGTPVGRPPPTPLTTAIEDGSSSDSSASTADSISTLRPSSETHIPPSNPWPDYFDQELYLDHTTADTKATYHVYLTAPKNPSKDPLFVCHHGAGASAMSFALFARSVRAILPTSGILALSARAHGSTVISITTDLPVDDFSLDTLVSDTLTTISLVHTHMSWTPSSRPPLVLVGHSLGGAIATRIAASGTLGAQLVGFAVLDVVEGSALEALLYMKTYLSSRPSSFSSVESAVDWHVRSRTLRNVESARASVPSLLVRGQGDDAERWVWRTDLMRTQRWWEGWFKGMSEGFLRGKAAKSLVLAGTDRLDRELMVGQMQGKFQLTVIPEAGHFVQEDVPEKVAQLMVDFFKRNDRSAMVLPPKVSDLIAQGKKV